MPRPFKAANPLPIKSCRQRRLSTVQNEGTSFSTLLGALRAKEATLKALGTGWQKGIRWKDVETAAGPLGKPELTFHRKAKQLFDESGATRALVTITHASDYAVAVVILET